MTSDLVVETLATDPKRGDIHLLVALTSLRPKGHLLKSERPVACMHDFWLKAVDERGRGRGILRKKLVKLVKLMRDSQSVSRVLATCPVAMITIAHA